MEKNNVIENRYNYHSINNLQSNDTMADGYIDVPSSDRIGEKMMNMKKSGRNMGSALIWNCLFLSTTQCITMESPRSTLVDHMFIGENICEWAI